MACSQDIIHRLGMYDRKEAIAQIVGFPVQESNRSALSFPFSHPLLVVVCVVHDRWSRINDHLTRLLVTFFADL